MKTGSTIFHQIYFKSTGYSFTHMGRLFLRLFVGIMLAQFGVRQLIDGGEGLQSFYFLPYVSYGLHEWLVIVVEIICPFFIMLGFCTRIMIIPPFILMIVSSATMCTFSNSWNLGFVEMQTIPFLFMGIFLFMILCGPGKISVDYFYSLYLINRQKGEEEDLEEV